VVVRAQAEGDGIVGATLEKRVFHHHAGCEYADHLAPNQASCRCRVFDLVAQGDAQTRLEQFAHVALEGVVGHTGERKALALAQLTRGQRDAENRRRPLGVLAEGLVEIPEPEENDGVGMFAFDPLVLLENWARLQGTPFS
jgi:hypothetical protein